MKQTFAGKLGEFGRDFGQLMAGTPLTLNETEMSQVVNGIAHDFAPFINSTVRGIMKGFGLVPQGNASDAQAAYDGRETENLVIDNPFQAWGDMMKNMKDMMKNLFD